MNRVAVSIVALTFLSFSAMAEDATPAAPSAKEPKRISADEADKHFQETCVVTGKVAQVSIREKLVYVNLDKKFPETPLACVIFARTTNQFGDLKALEGKSVEVTGRIDEFKEKLQIVLNSTNQLKVVESASGAVEKK